jgi:hypothetical protein
VAIKYNSESLGANPILLVATEKPTSAVGGLVPGFEIMELRHKI